MDSYEIKYYSTKGTPSYLDNIVNCSEIIYFFCDLLKSILINPKIFKVRKIMYLTIEGLQNNSPYL